MTLIGIVCTDKNGGIGFNNTIPWHTKPLSDEAKLDLKFFKDKTLGKNCLVGYNTYHSLPKLEDRNLILVDHTTDLNQYKNSNELFYVIGGSFTYHLCKNYIHTWHFNILKTAYQCDRFFKFEELIKYYVDNQILFEIETSIIFSINNSLYTNFLYNVEIRIITQLKLD